MENNSDIFVKNWYNSKYVDIFIAANANDTIVTCDTVQSCFKQRLLGNENKDF